MCALLELEMLQEKVYLLDSRSRGSSTETNLVSRDVRVTREANRLEFYLLLCQELFPDFMTRVINHSKRRERTKSINIKENRQ